MFCCLFCSYGPQRPLELKKEEEEDKHMKNMLKFLFPSG